MRVTEELVKWYLEKEEADKINRRIAERRKKKRMDKRSVFADRKGGRRNG